MGNVSESCKNKAVPKVLGSQEINSGFIQCCLMIGEQGVTDMGAGTQESITNRVADLLANQGPQTIQWTSVT